MWSKTRSDFSREAAAQDSLETILTRSFAAGLASPPTSSWILDSSSWLLFFCNFPPQHRVLPMKAVF
jgi:hypothetical protein